MGHSTACILVIPALNEAKTISGVLKRAGAIPSIVVDGGSDDGTAEIAGKSGAKVIIERRRGVGCACKTGFAAANSEYVAFLDADGTYFPEDIDAALRLVKNSGADAVFGNRFGRKENYVRFHRKIANELVTLFIDLLFGTNLQDSQSGFFIVKKSSLEKMPSSDSYSFVQELKIRMEKGKKKCLQIPIRYVDRESGSKFNFLLDGMRLAYDAVALRLWWN